MTQFARRTHPARVRLDEIAPRARWAYEMTDTLRAERAADAWPDHVYCPMSAVIDALPDALYRIGGRAALEQFQALGPLGMVQVVDPLLTMAAWRMTQGIYRIDPAAYPHIVDTPLDDAIPAGVLTRLPEWCVYVETPGLTTLRADGSGTVDVLGAWARQDIEPGTGAPMLVIMLLVPGDHAPACQYLPLTGSIPSVIATLVAQWRAAGLSVPEAADDAIVGYLRPIINVLLYIASTADITRRGRSDVQPGNPEPVRTRRHGWRLFPADGPAEWDVGVRIGAALRAAYAREEVGRNAAPTGRSVRPHVRRAHWHTILSGPRKRADGSAIASDQRRADLRWMPPLPINVTSMDEVPAVVRSVPAEKQGGTR